MRKGCRRALWHKKENKEKGKKTVLGEGGNEREQVWLGRGI